MNQKWLSHQEESLEVQEQYVAFLVQNVFRSLRIRIDVLGRDKEVLKLIQNCHSLVLLMMMRSNAEEKWI